MAIKTGEIVFNEAIFIPAKNRFREDEVSWKRLSKMEYLKKDEKHIINIFIVKCKSKEDIPQIFENQIALIKEIIDLHPQSSHLFEWQLKYFEDILKRINNSSEYRKELPKEIQRIVSIKEKFPGLRPDQVVFTRSIKKMKNF